MSRVQFTQDELERMKAIVNTSLQDTNCRDLNVNTSDFDPDPKYPGLIALANTNDNFVTRIFDRSSFNRIYDHGQFYHFKRLDIAMNILTNKSIQVSNLLSNSENDFAELTEFHKRLGLFHKIIPKDYCDQRQAQPYNPTSTSQIDEDRENIFILCFTKDGHNNLFWEKYVRNDQGVCLVFKFIEFHPNRGLFSFRDVSYDAGYSFEFFNHINFHFKKEFKRELLLNGFSKFASFYKRGKYQWENETRLVFNYLKGIRGSGDELIKIFPIQEAGNRRYFDLPLDGNRTPNPLFRLTVSEVICGNKVGPAEVKAIKDICAKNFPNAFVWQRRIIGAELLDLNKVEII